jgi:D-alanyl-D-alanine carboxypeptidase
MMSETHDRLTATMQLLPGDEALGIANGSIAEHASAPADKPAPKPDNITTAQAPACPVPTRRQSATADPCRPAKRYWSSARKHATGRSPCRKRTAARRLREMIVCTAFLAAVGIGNPVGAAAKGTEATALTRTINKVMRDTSTPGAIVGVWQKGETPYIKAFGVRNMATRQPMSTNLYMRIGSESKTFTVTAILQLVDQGKVRLDDPISTYVSGVPSGNRITIRQLAEMRSGLPSYTGDPAFLRAALTNPIPPFTPSQLLSYSFSQPLLFSPGTTYNYSNTNLVLLGLVVEKVSHQSLARYITQHVLAPEHLTHTIFPTGTEFPSPHAQGYTKQTLDGKQANATNWNPSWAWADGGMISTLGDLHHWARDVATGNLLTPATQQQRLRFIPIPKSAGAGVGVGYGLALFNVKGWIGHNGSLPGYESLTIYLPSQQATVVVLLNTNIDLAAPDVSLIGQAITRIITPKHVFYLP